ncbi:uncharacterized protein J8A68_004180 [[Candida] subhashii]|uniref:Cytidyltransferase-like domain-containing protein n=1 Tax=[Candida] subhashii TaxID=561895 RepID=A0A8J5QBM9_9ASCO|nr:uncharacterized protein J8A68_004180 [[Candida] subhashii]KAG7662286.1 hypothetical protein J8A68_004180 [[Candida] subhashii]
MQKMTNPVIIINNPCQFDYSQAIEHVIKERAFGINRLDIFIVEPIKDSNHLNEILFYYYNVARKAALDKGYDYNFEVNILFNITETAEIFKLIQHWNVAFILQQEESVALHLHQVLTEVLSFELPKVAYPTSGKVTGQFDTTAVGGTFDHIHDGHKILLSMNAFLTKRKLIVGITGAEMLKKKKFAEVLQSYESRQQSVLDFFRLIVGQRDIQFELYEINDICGPTGYVKEIDSLIISAESVSGGDFVNKYRLDHGFNELDITVINVIGSEESTSDNSWKGKLSSTDIREQHAKRLLQFQK